MKAGRLYSMGVLNDVKASDTFWCRAFDIYTLYHNYNTHYLCGNQDIILLEKYPRHACFFCDDDYCLPFYGGIVHIEFVKKS